MSTVQQPLTLKFNGSGTPTQTNPDGTPIDPNEDEVSESVYVIPQSGPPVPVDAQGAPLNLDVSVLRPYNQTTSPGVIVVG